ncbi:MAG: UDP-N-acetylmuramate dehydrogenase [Pseudanabaenaceae cyanobacterium]
MSTSASATSAIRTDVPLRGFTSFKVGGNADCFAAPHNPEELRAVLDWGYSRAMPLTVLGAGSNLLIGDRGVRGLVICLRNLRGARIDAKQGRIVAAAGEPVARLAWQAAAAGLSGLEWAVGIPGTLGGLVAMNAGAQGGCAADCVLNVEAIAPNGMQRTLMTAALEYRYRHSRLQESGDLVVSATLQLQPGCDPAVVAQRTETYLQKRKSTQPYHLPSCGSVFRNPPQGYAGQLIEATGLKGYTLGRAQVAELHANFILNLGGATAKNIRDLIGHVRDCVQDRTGILLVPEVKMLGEF